MEKESKQAVPQNSQVKIHACFEELDTLRFLPFLQHKEGKIIYRGVTQEQNRKSKEFSFNAITLLTDKLKHSHNQVIRDVVEALLRGESKSVLIFGNDEAKKQKLLIGESQNAGLMLLILSQLFNTCYDRELEDKITIKLSCWQQRDDQTSDGFATNQSIIFEDDQFQGKILIGNPEIIVRNMKSALKIIKLFMRRAEQAREQKQDATQTLVMSIKLEIDNAYDKQGNVTEYLLSKLHVVKFANPYSVKATGKHPQWFISLFNQFQADALQKMRNQEQVVEDDVISYLKECVIKGVHGIHCFTCFGNKMSPNECLTTLKFSSYLQFAKLAPKNMLIKLPQIKKESLVLQSDLLKNEEEKVHWIQGKEFQWFQSQEQETMEQFKQILRLNIQGMELGNILQYQYAISLTTACDKLQKYIFNEEVEDYFYAKKVSIEVTPQLKQAISKFIDIKKKTFQFQRKLLQRISANQNKLRREPSDNRAVKYLINSKVKQKQIYQKLFQIYNAEVAHFLYEENQELVSRLEKYQQKSAKPAQAQPAAPTPAVQLSSFSLQVLEKIKDPEAPQPPCRTEIKKKKAVNELEMMFTNTNASLCGRRLKN